MCLLGLLATLAGTPLRISEAASDLARTFSDPSDRAEVGEIDGGVGDDSDATIRSDPARAPILGLGADLPFALNGPARDPFRPGPSLAIRETCQFLDPPPYPRIWLTRLRF